LEELLEELLQQYFQPLVVVGWRGHEAVLAKRPRTENGERRRAIARQADGADGLEHAAGWVEQLAGMAKR
jgi:hypothetical protein